MFWPMSMSEPSTRRLGGAGRGVAERAGREAHDVLAGAVVGEQELAGVQGDPADHRGLLDQRDAGDVAQAGVAAVDQQEETALAVVARRVGTEDKDVFFLVGDATDRLTAVGRQQQVAGVQLHGVGSDLDVARHTVHAH